MHPSTPGGPIPTTAGGGQGPRRDAIAEMRRLTLAGAGPAPPSASLEAASVPDGLGFG